MDHLDLDVVLEHLGDLRPELVGDVPFTELEWILSDFLLSWGGRLPLHPGDWPPEPERTRLRSFGVTFLPFSTAADFPSVDPSQVRTLALAATCLNLHVMLLDPIVDAPLAMPASAKLVLQHVLMHFDHLLSLLFPPGSPFWGELERLMRRMSCTMLEEHQRLGDPLRPFSLAEFQRIARGKMAFAQVNCVALAILNGTPHLIPALGECWDVIGLASIARDDSLDWREDYANANYTYLLAQVLQSSLFSEGVAAGRLPEPAEIGAALFCTDLIETLYSLAYEQLGAAAGRAVEIGCPALANLLRQLQTILASRSAKLFERRMAALVGLEEEPRTI